MNVGESRTCWKCGSGVRASVADATIKMTEFIAVRLSVSMATGFFQEGRKYLTLAIGCTGGKHRSVAIAEELSRRLNASGSVAQKQIQATAIHRDLGREV